MGDAPKQNNRKTDREERLAAALRANLQRRKAAKQESRKAAKQEAAEKGAAGKDGGGEAG